MTTRISPWCIFTAISLVSLSGFAAHAGAQVDVLNRHGSQPKFSARTELSARTERTHKAKRASQANSNYQVLYTFCSAANCTDGAAPFASLIMDAEGNLYGTTGYGGTGKGSQFYSGTVFKLVPPVQPGGSWTEAMLAPRSLPLRSAQC